MPFPTGVANLVISPPIAILRPILDENGPYGFGDYTITQFTTSTSHGLLPAGTWDVGGTYGVVVQPTTIPPTWGYDIGYSSSHAIGGEGFRYHNRFAQVVVSHAAVGGAYLPIQVVDCHYLQTVIKTEFVPFAGDEFGLHVEPDIVVDLFFLTLLA